MFEDTKKQVMVSKKSLDIEDYSFDELISLSQIRKQYGLSPSALQTFIRRNNIPKKQAWKEVFVPVDIIKDLLG